MAGKKSGVNTRLVHGAGFEDPYRSANVPIYQTSTFYFDSAEHGARCFDGTDKGYIYTRIGNPTINALEQTVALLEGGFGATGTGSGMGAVTTIYMALLGQGMHMISSDAVYGPSRSVMEDHFSRFGVESTYTDTSDTEKILKAIKPNTKVLYVETPANPTMNISDLEACAKIAKDHNLYLVVDNTFCSPYLQNPIAYGADIVFHSMTKFINGHADIVGGMIVAKTEELHKRIRTMMVNMGCNLDPHQSYMVLRGLKTLGIRIDRAQQNAIKVAEYLEKHPKVEWIKYPGLKSHPQYELAKKQMRGPGTMISFGLKGGFKAGKVLMDNIHLALLAVSLGGVESLIQHPASMTHSKLSKEKKDLAGITDGLVRYSVGIEDVDDIISDLDFALSKV